MLRNTMTRILTLRERLFNLKPKNSEVIVINMFTGRMDCSISTAKARDAGGIAEVVATEWIVRVRAVIESFVTYSAGAADGIPVIKSIVWMRIKTLTD